MSGTNAGFETCNRSKYSMLCLFAFVVRLHWVVLAQAFRLKVIICLAGYFVLLLLRFEVVFNYSESEANQTPTTSNILLLRSPAFGENKRSAIW